MNEQWKGTVVREGVHPDVATVDGRGDLHAERCVGAYQPNRSRHCFFRWRPLSFRIETPNEVRGGCSGLAAYCRRLGRPSRIKGRADGREVGRALAEDQKNRGERRRKAIGRQ